MRLLYTILLGCMLSLCLNAQKQQVIEKTFQTDANKKIELDLKYATNIIVHTTDKAETTFKVIMRYNEPGMEKVHALDIEDESDLLSIKTDYDFDAHRPTGKECLGMNHSFNNNLRYCLTVAYELTVPKNASLRLESISGNIEVIDFTGDLRAKTISGFVDVSMPPSHPTRLKFNTVTGEIYTDFDVPLHKNSSAYSKKVSTAINGDSNQLLSLESVSGDIFFRKVKI